MCFLPFLYCRQCDLIVRFLSYLQQTFFFWLTLLHIFASHFDGQNEIHEFSPSRGFIKVRTVYIIFYFLKWGQSQALFVYIRLFHMTQFKYKLIKRRWCAWDSNLGQNDERCRRNHWAKAAPTTIFLYFNFHYFAFRDLQKGVRFCAAQKKLKKCQTVASLFCRKKLVLTFLVLLKLVSERHKNFCKSKVSASFCKKGIVHGEL